MKDVKFALRGHVADLVLRRLEHAHASGNDNNAATLGVEWSDAVCNQLASWVRFFEIPLFSFTFDFFLCKAERQC